MATRPSILPIWATDLGATIIGSLAIDNINWQSVNTIRYTFTGSPDLSGVSVANSLVTSSCTNTLNNGQFIITAVNNTTKYIEITNTSITDNTYDETGSPGTAIAVVSSAVITEPTTARKYQGWLTPEKPPDGTLNWFQNLVYLWIKYFDEGGSSAITYYETIDDLIAVDTATLADFTLHLVVGYGVYLLNLTSTEPDDGQIVVAPTTGLGKYNLVAVHPDWCFTALQPQIDDLQAQIDSLIANNALTP